LEAKISGDPKYESSPLMTSFDISAVNSISAVPFDQLMIYYVIPITVSIGGIVIAINILRRKYNQQ
jgi:hypothetical protein